MIIVSYTEDKGMNSAAVDIWFVKSRKIQDSEGARQISICQTDAPSDRERQRG